LGLCLGTILVCSIGKEDIGAYYESDGSPTSLYPLITCTTYTEFTCPLGPLGVCYGNDLMLQKRAPCHNQVFRRDYRPRCSHTRLQALQKPGRMRHRKPTRCGTQKTQSVVRPPTLTLNVSASRLIARGFSWLNPPKQDKL
jgi:hypothetical protein